jgi:hypothetical protein
MMDTLDEAGIVDVFLHCGEALEPAEPGCALANV